MYAANHDAIIKKYKNITNSPQQEIKWKHKKYSINKKLKFLKGPYSGRNNKEWIEQLDNKEQHSKWSEVAQSCPTLSDPVDCSLPCSSIHGILQTRVLEWGAIFFSRGSSQPRDWTQVFHNAGTCFTVWATM